MSEGNRTNSSPGRMALVGLVTGLVIGAALMLTFRGSPGDAVGPEEEELHADEGGALELSEAAQQNAGVQITTVSRERLPETIEATGTVTPVESRVAHMRPLAQGIVERVAVSLGARVTAGQELLSYDNVVLGDLIGEYRSAVAAQRQREADLEVRRQHFERAGQLVEIEAIAKQTLELRRAEFLNAEAGVASARAEVARIEERIHRFGVTDDDLARLAADEADPDRDVHREASHNVLRAPFAGVVTAYDVAVGEMVEPERELLAIADLSTVWVLADIYERDIARVRPGTKAIIRTEAYPDRIFTGEVTYVSDVIEPATRTARVRCVVSNSDGALKLDMFTTVTIPTAVERDAIVVPADAVQQIDGLSVVFVQTAATTFERRDVELGMTVGDRVEIVAGLEPAEQVVSAGSFYLKTALLRERIGDEH
ncbi:MAG: efflux RND transporter periplasmic adaptor subunit [Vicinamibacterales bacterium]